MTISPAFQRVLRLLRDLIIAVVAVDIGLTFGRVLSGWGAPWPITLMGIALYALVILANPLAGMLLWIATAPFSRFLYLDLVLGRGIPDLTLTRICTGLLVLVVLAQVAIRKRRGIRLSLVDGAVLAALVGIGASLPAAMDGLTAAVTNYSDTYLVPGIIFFLARFLVRERRHAESVCTAFITLGAILTTVAVQEQLSGSVLFVYSERSWYYTKDIHRLAGLIGSPAFFATLIAMASGFAVYRFVRARSFSWRAAYGLLTVYTIIGVYFTFNRAGWLSLALNLIILAISWPSFRRVFVAVAVAGVAALVLSWGTIQNSAVVTQRLGAKGPLSYRMEIWGRAAQIIASSPIAGLGYSNFARVYLRYNPEWEKSVVAPAPHNSFLEVLFNTGLVGGVPYIAMYIIITAGIVRFYHRARAPDDRALILAFALAPLAYLVQAVVVDMISGYYVNMVVMLAVGSLFGWQREGSQT